MGGDNLPLAARCHNWESMFVVKTRQDVMWRFDAMWDSLKNRTTSVFDPNEALFPEKERAQILSYKAEPNETQAAVGENLVASSKT